MGIKMKCGWEKGNAAQNELVLWSQYGSRDHNISDFCIVTKEVASQHDSRLQQGKVWEAVSPSSKIMIVSPVAAIATLCSCWGIELIFINWKGRPRTTIAVFFQCSQIFSAAIPAVPAEGLRSQQSYSDVQLQWFITFLNSHTSNSIQEDEIIPSFFFISR